jgi:dihydrofolate reductase
MILAQSAGLPANVLPPGAMRISLIAAVASNGVIGRANTLPWRIKADMAFFKEKTLGHVVITGRKNFDAMGKALPKRHNVVVTRDAAFGAPDVIVCSTLGAALRHAQAQGEKEVFVIGGAQLYALALPHAHTFYRTRVLATVDGDVTFPTFDEGQWTTQQLARHESDEQNEHAFVIEELNRTSAPESFASS